LKRSDFYKSTNEFHNPRVWQDVYKTGAGEGKDRLNLYVKLKITEINKQTLLILSFKKGRNILKRHGTEKNGIITNNHRK